MPSLLLSIDIGTTAVKAGCFTPEGKILGSSYVEYTLLHPAHLCIEHDANLWWSLSRQVVLEALSVSGVSSDEIAALSISAQGISYVPVDEAGNPLHNVFSWMDTRAVEQTDRIRNLFVNREEAFRRVGLHVVPTYTLPKILWLKDHHPEIFRAAHKFSTCLDFMNKRLVNRFITDYSIAGGTLAHDLDRLAWSDFVLEGTGVPKEKLPEINWGGTPLGELCPAAARELGLPDTVHVLLGGHDQECAALGAGLQNEEVSISLGTASILIAPLSAPAFDPGLRIPCYPHVEKDRFVLEAVVSAGGGSFKWLRDLYNSIAGGAGGKPYDYDALVDLAMRAPVGANGVRFYPHLSGATSPYWNPNSTGVFHGLSLGSNPADVVRAVLEGWCYQLKSNLVVIEELTGKRERIVVFGGGARNQRLQQLIASVLGRPVVVSPTSETALLGAAMLAGVGTGIYRDLDEAKAVVRQSSTYRDPETQNIGRYQELYERYREIEGDQLQIL